MATQDLPRARLAGRERVLDIRPGLPGLPVLLLLLAVLLALLAAYSVRPFVAIDIGARNDYPYLSGFHAREFSADTPARTYAWPAGSDSLQINEGLSPAFRMVTFTLDDFTPSDPFPRRLIAVYANEQQLTTLNDRGGNRDFRVLLPEELAAGNQLLLRLEPIADRSLDIPPVQALEATLSAARTYRWTDGQGVVRLPALGRGIWRVELTTIVAHPDSKPVNAQLLANGIPLAQLPDYGGPRRLSFLVPEAIVGEGDLTLTFASDVYNDPRPLGMLVERVMVTPADGASGPRGSLPPWSALLPGLAIALCMYGSLRWLAIPRWTAFGLAGMVAVFGAWALVAYRFPMGLYLQPLAWLMLFSALLVPLADRLCEWVFRRLGIPLAPWMRHALVLMFIVGFWLKGGGMVYPYMRSIDIGWHMDRVRWILDGNLAAMYQPGAFSESVMPINEWGPNRPVIPYSPFFHLFSTLFVLFPWPMELSANLFSALLDTSRVFLIAILALKSGLSNRVALLATLMYAITPFTFLLHSWGNVPTTFGMWWTLVATVVIVALYPKLNQRGPLTVLALVTLACLLFYTVMAVFYGLFVIGFLLVLWLRPAEVDRRPLRGVILATVLAIVLSLLIYYGQYIPSMIERTIPYMTSLATAGPESVGVEREPFSLYLSRYIPHLDYHMWPGDFLYYGVAIPALFAIPGFIALRKKPVIWAIMASWYTIAVFFLLAGYRISMVDKQLFYVFPAICLCWAIYADRFWQRGWWGKLFIGVIYLFTLVSALDLWVIRIIRSPIE